MLYQSAIDCIGDTPLVRLSRLRGSGDVCIMAKLEMLNPGGSIKDRAAKYMIEQGMRDGVIQPNSHVIESSSGNFGIAAAMVAKHYELKFTCVVDPKICGANLAMLRLLGAGVEMVYESDDAGGYLKTRLARVRELLGTVPRAVWLNQYANNANWRAHYEGIAEEIIRDVGLPPDCVVVAVSTGGTIMGIGRRLKECYHNVRVIAVDVYGSVIFGSPAGARDLPGIGSSVVPEILDRTVIDEVVYVTSEEAIAGALELLNAESIFAGGSSGAVIAAIKLIAPKLPVGYRIVTVLPDRGERYLDSLYLTQTPRRNAVVGSDARRLRTSDQAWRDMTSQRDRAPA